jgi:hypothetical protein
VIGGPTTGAAAFRRPSVGSFWPMRVARTAAGPACGKPSSKNSWVMPAGSPSRCATIRRAARSGIPSSTDCPAPIRVNWAGVPLRTFGTIVRYIAGTVTAAGRRVAALLKRGGNETGERVSDDEMRRLHLAPHAVCPAWNYTVSPRTS